MKHLIISFKSRNELYGFARVLKSNGIYLSIINSPKGVGSSCMLSIKTEYKNFNTLSRLLRQYHPTSFVGLYSIQLTTNGEQIFKLI